jgi:hypothetical protein
MAVVILLVDKLDHLALDGGAAVNKELGADRKRDAGDYKQETKPNDQLASEGAGERYSGLEPFGHAHTVAEGVVDGRINSLYLFQKKEDRCWARQMEGQGAGRWA